MGAVPIHGDWTPACLLRERAEDVASTAADSAAEAVIMMIATPIANALQQIFLLLFSWLLVPAVDLVGGCSPWLNSGAADCTVDPSEQLRRWTLPVTGLVLFGGLLWQGLVAAVTRKGQSLLQAGKGLVAAAVWGDAEAVTELRWIVLGLAVLVMSIVALPAMMKFFSWTVGQERHSGGGGQALAGAAMSGMYALGSVHSGGSSAADQARATEQSMGTPSGGRRDQP